MNDEKYPLKKRIANGLFVLMAVIAFFVVKDKLTEKGAEVGNVAVQAPKTKEDAAALMVGTWTYTKPLDRARDFPFQWIKWVVEKNGKMTIYYADPRDNDWGTGVVADYEVATDKYADTGERWFGIKNKKDAIWAIYDVEQKKLVLRLVGNQSTGAMDRGDKNPFSK